jgi:hypothetical protein
MFSRYTVVREAETDEKMCRYVKELEIVEQGGGGFKIGAMRRGTGKANFT